MVGAAEIVREVAAAVRGAIRKDGKRSSTPPNTRWCSAIVVSAGWPMTLPK